MNFNPRTPCGVRHANGICTALKFIFQSTHPLRGATGLASAMFAVQRILIHAPLAGCDAQGIGRCVRTDISIHAPLAGCDRLPATGCSSCQHFNPRTPCGVRQYVGDRLWTPSRFQSTHPLRGATSSTVKSLTFGKFQSTHPLRGATYIYCTEGRPDLFQSTHPLRGATHVAEACNVSKTFQSTHPLRGATRLSFT